MSKRAAIIQLHRAGHSNSKIMKLLKAPKLTVCDTILCFQELGTMEDRDRSGRPRSACTPAKIKALRERIQRNPKRSLRKTAKDMNIGHESVRTIVEQDLKMSPYKIRTRQLLTDLQKQKRKERAKILLNCLKGGTEKGEIVFSDEKLFSVEAKFNTQNDRILGKSPKDLPDHLRFVSRRQKPSSVMVWGAISKSWKSPLIFVKEGVKVNTDSYVNDILTPALASMKEKFKNKSFTFQQDGAPSHTSKKMQKWCEEHFPSFWTKDLWPPSSPDLNPMDFCMWGTLEKEACSSPHNNLEDLRASLKRAWEKIPQDALRAACQNFRQRLQRVIDTDGGHFE